MIDAEVEQLLRSDAPLVIIEAPAGCGKTHQAANYTERAGKELSRGKVLVLTHTHAACSVIAERTKGVQRFVDIRTLDSLVFQIASAYRLSLDLPEDVASWARKQSDGYGLLATKTAKLLEVNPMICINIARHFPIVICDEHQDANENQDAIVRLIQTAGATVRVFADPMQIIPGGNAQKRLAASAHQRWEAIKASGSFGNLESPHRWNKTNPELGAWIQSVRLALHNHVPINLSSNLPDSVQIIYAENGIPANRKYQIRPDNWTKLNAIVDQDRSMLLLASNNEIISGLRSSLQRRIPIWEGHKASKHCSRHSPGRLS